MNNRPAATAEREKLSSADDTTEEQSEHKIGCFCDALYVLPRIRKIVPTSYPVPGFKCDHDEVCRRLTDLQMIRIGDVQWKCVDSAPLIEGEKCQPKGDLFPAACPCAHPCLSRTRIAGLPTRLTACEDWKTNPKAIELLSKAPLTASQWKTFRLAESTIARDTSTTRARVSMPRKPPLVHRPWLINTGSMSLNNQPGFYPTESLLLDNMPRARLAQLKGALHTAAMHATPPISHLGETGTSRTSDARRQFSLSSAEFPFPADQAQELQAYNPVVHSQLGSLWQNAAADQQPIRSISRFDPLGQLSGSILRQETGNLDAIERQAAMLEIGAQSSSGFLREADERRSAELDQTQTRPLIQSGAATSSGSKRKADQMHVMPHLSSQSLLNVGSLSFAARFGIDAGTILAAAQCPATPAGQIGLVDPASDMNLEGLPASHVGISSLGSLTDQMPEYTYANDESTAADQAQEIDQTLNELADEWAWEFL